MKALGWMAATLLAMMLSVCVQADSRPAVGAQVKAYSDGQGLNVWVVRFGPRSAQQALVQVTGVAHAWDRQIQKMDVQGVQDEAHYTLPVAGKPFVALTLRGSSGELYLPGEQQGHPLHYDATLSSNGNAQHFLSDYLEQSE
ncbi:hypothetical protein [Pseudomonas schmalbachii]|nr:hypothetical protein [Pseudomonas schmalbachii]